MTANNGTASNATASASTGRGSSFPVAAVAGGAAGATVALAAGAALFILLRRRGSSEKTSSAMPGTPSYLEGGPGTPHMAGSPMGVAWAGVTASKAPHFQRVKDCDIDAVVVKGNRGSGAEGGGLFAQASGSSCLVHWGPPESRADPEPRPPTTLHRATAPASAPPCCSAHHAFPPQALRAGSWT